MGEVLSKCIESPEEVNGGNTATDAPDAVTGNEVRIVKNLERTETRIGLEYGESSHPFLHGNLTITIHEAKNLPNTDK